jgi:hypothetical protein
METIIGVEGRVGSLFHPVFTYSHGRQGTPGNLSAGLQGLLEADFRSIAT